MKITFFGECMVELSGQPLLRTFGGDTLNTALYLARLGGKRNIQVSYATALGVDNISQDMLVAWRQENINTELVRTIEDKLPGLYLVETEPCGERHFHYWRNDSAAKFYFAEPTASPLEQAIDAHSVDALYISGISLAILSEDAKAVLVTLLEKHKQNGGRVLFDNNFRPQLWTAKQAQYWYSQVLPFVDIALITEEDDKLVWGEGDIVQRCQNFGCQEVVIKRGAEPCKVATELQSDSPEVLYVAATKVSKVIDTCAAGDSFAAGYLAGRLSGESASASAELAHQLAAIVIQHRGAIIPLDTMKDII
ncbi:2-dehydro-3-deoxygluconokinase [Photobacterium jeanii]|uniref:2-dehydro-3-deoxygluconokinase n=1 Tax=Photobacterium jeanii TaxID=858640 RepID=A0A178K8Q2_9GAMM|nr:sugar kinase [Photobacterium jeanii]OAN13729.1 2-dehydro-3-deoxygluconokinase [Photobacterium jeanii]PST88851.1 sugar kinase [Photobacterium jeanii]